MMEDKVDQRAWQSREKERQGVRGQGQAILADKDQDRMGRDICCDRSHIESQWTRLKLCPMAW